MCKIKHENNAAKIAVIFSLVATAISIFAFFTSKPYNWGVDFVGTAFSIMFALVTLLIGWNIYTVIDTKQTLKRLNSVDETISQAVRKIKSEWQEDLLILYPLFTRIGKTPAERITKNLIAFYNAREDAWFVKALPREYIYGVIDDVYNNENSLFEPLITDVAKHEDVTKLVVVKFYQDFLQQSCEEQAKHEGVTKFLDALLKEVKP